MRINLFELIYRYIYPAVRRRLAEILYYDEGLNQRQIAEILGVTQSAVSRYVDGYRGMLVDFKDYPEINNELRELAKKIVSNKIDKYIVQVEIAYIIFRSLARKRLCSLHLKVDPTIDYSKCSICPMLFKPFVEG